MAVRLYRLGSQRWTQWNPCFGLSWEALISSELRPVSLSGLRVRPSSWPLRSERPYSICWALWARVILASWAWLSPVSRWCHEFLTVVKRASVVSGANRCICLFQRLPGAGAAPQGTGACWGGRGGLPSCWVGQRERNQLCVGFLYVRQKGLDH